MTTNNATHSDLRGVLLRELLSQVLASLEILNVLSAWPEIGGSPIASRSDDVWSPDCENADFAAARKNQRELDAALADEADQQKRSEDTLPRKTFMLTGISEPFD
jgi:hypothetical protein